MFQNYILVCYQVPQQNNPAILKGFPPIDNSIQVIFYNI